MKASVHILLVMLTRDTKRQTLARQAWQAMLEVYGECARGPDLKDIKLPILSLFWKVPFLFLQIILIY